MTEEEAIDIIKSECYVFNPLNFDRSTMINTALDMAVNALKSDKEELTCTEYNLFMYAMEKEKDFIEVLFGEVPSKKDKIIKICGDLERKVLKALWQ